MTALEGGCLCGGVRYRITGRLGPIGHCHCRTCQKVQGTAFATTARVAWSDFAWRSGESLLRAHESSPGKRRTFCERCGSPLLAAWDGQDALILRLGSLDGDPGARPRLHIWTSHRAPWYPIGDALPRFEAGYVAPPDDAR